MEKNKFLKRFILTGVFVVSISFIRTCAMEGKKIPKINNKQEEYYEKIKQYVKMKRASLWNYYFQDECKLKNSTGIYLFRNNSDAFEDEDKELTNEEKKDVIQSVEIIRNQILERMSLFDKDNIRCIYKMYNKFNLRLESYLDEAKRGIIDVKMKDLNNIVLNWIKLGHYLAFMIRHMG